MVAAANPTHSSWLCRSLGFGFAPNHPLCWRCRGAGLRHTRLATTSHLRRSPPAFVDHLLPSSTTSHYLPFHIGIIFPSVSALSSLPYHHYLPSASLLSASVSLLSTLPCLVILLCPCYLFLIFLLSVFPRPIPNKHISNSKRRVNI
jgi:hypothetical protein